LNYGKTGLDFSLFTGLVNGATIAMAMTENDEQIILLEKEDRLKGSIKDPEELERPAADLMFSMDAKDMASLLKK